MTQEGLLRASILYCSKRPWDYLAHKLLGGLLASKVLIAQTCCSVTNIMPHYGFSISIATGCVKWAEHNMGPPIYGLHKDKGWCLAHKPALFHSFHHMSMW